MDAPKKLASESQTAIIAQCNADDVQRLAIDLIGIESHRSSPTKESTAAAFIKEQFLRSGIPAELREVRPGRPNVIAVLKGMDTGRKLIFNGHTDTVPPGTMEYPFEAQIENGMLTGRGSCDMKGGLAAQICAMTALKKAEAKLAGDVIFTGVIAEEDGTSLGSLDIVHNGPRADMVIVAEPTDLRVAIAHKGFDYFKIEIEGRAVHSSQPEKGINAIYRAAGIVSAIEQKLLPELAKTTHPLLGSGRVNVASIVGFPTSEAATALGRKGPIEKPDGGTVPDFCTVSLDHRRLPGSTHLDFAHKLKALIAGLPQLSGTNLPIVSFVPACPELDSHPPLDTDPHDALVIEALSIASAVTGDPEEPIGVPYWSDAALFNAHWQVPAIVFGPGNIAVAHSNLERVALDQLTKATRINALLAIALLGVDRTAQKGTPLLATGRPHL